MLADQKTNKTKNTVVLNTITKSYVFNWYASYAIHEKWIFTQSWLVD